MAWRSQPSRSPTVGQGGPGGSCFPHGHPSTSLGAETCPCDAVGGSQLCPDSGVQGAGEGCWGSIDVPPRWQSPPCLPAQRGGRALTRQDPGLALPWLLPALLPSVPTPSKMAEGWCPEPELSPLLPAGPRAEKRSKTCPEPRALATAWVWRQGAACNLQHLPGAAVEGRGCLGRAGPTRCAGTAGAMVYPHHYPPSQPLRSYLKP